MKTGNELNPAAEKSQPQILLESIIPHDENEKYPSDPEPPSWVPVASNDGETKFPSIESQQKYWDDKEKAAEPKPPRKWSLARRRKFNATVAKKKDTGWSPVPPPPQEAKVPQVRFCPNCGCGLERWLS